jgi:hypothetical protein
MKSATLCILWGRVLPLDAIQGTRAVIDAGPTQAGDGVVDV